MDDDLAKLRQQADSPGRAGPWQPKQTIDSRIREAARGDRPSRRAGFDQSDNLYFEVIGITVDKSPYHQ